MHLPINWIARYWIIFTAQLYRIWWVLRGQYCTAMFRVFVYSLHSTKLLSQHWTAVVFIARQHVIHAEHDTVMANPSVCLSTLLLYRNECLCRKTLSVVWWGHDPLFWAPPTLKNSKAKSLSDGVIYTGKIWDFRPKSPFNLETVRDMLTATILCIKDRSVSVPLTLSDLERRSTGVYL